MGCTLEDVANPGLLELASPPVLCIRLPVWGVADTSSLSPKPFLIWKKEAKARSNGPREDGAEMRNWDDPKVYTGWTPFAEASPAAGTADSWW